MADSRTLSYTAEQIDAILAAAQRCSNRNLLDNWYFGNPVDQRGGYVVPPNTPYYSDTALSAQAGMVSAYTMAVKVNDTYGTITVSGTTYYVAWSAAVRGYTGAGYGIDRWSFDNDSGNATILITEDGIKSVNNSSATGIGAINQKIDPDLYYSLAGKTVTLSILGKSEKSQQLLLFVNDSVFAINSTAGSNNARITTLTATLPQTISNFMIYVYGASEAGAGEGYIYAVKFELGSQQTLAHQDENGNWVLNEIPDYGEQLARCQRYYQLYSSADKRPVKAVDCRPTMRVDPLQGTIVIDGTTYYYNSAEL